MHALKVDDEEENENLSVELTAEIQGENNMDAMETEDSEHNAGVPAPQSPVLEDGWQLVSTKTKRKPRKK
jgi:hypothetical protein